MIKYNNMKKIVLVVLVLLLSPVFCFASGIDKRKTDIVIAVEKASPAVVSVTAEYTETEKANPFSDLGIDSLFDNFFKDFFNPGFERKYKRKSLGSGVIIDGKRGYVLTNAHVISKLASISVISMDEREFDAKIVGVDADSDLAVLQIQSKTELPSIRMGNSDDIMIGETVIAIGNPFGFSHTVTTGVVSALNRSIKSDKRIFSNFIQTDASINPGNSGGTLLNINGELIGINTAIYEKAQGIGFAIPINRAKRIISDLLRYGEVAPVWTGLIVQDIDPDISDYLGISLKTGILIKGTENKSPAEEAGIKSGDIITAINGKHIRSQIDFTTAIMETAVGDELEIRLLRNKKEKTIKLKTRVFPLYMADDIALNLLGIKVSDNPNLKGVVISSVRNDSYMAKIGVLKGDTIHKIDDMTITNKKDFDKAIIKYRLKKSVAVLIKRGMNAYYVTIEM